MPSASAAAAAPAGRPELNLLPCRSLGKTKYERIGAERRLSDVENRVSLGGEAIDLNA